MTALQQQPEALRLADALDAGENFYAESSLWFDRGLGIQMDDLMLPEPLVLKTGYTIGFDKPDAYTADQMREYAKQAVEAEREACAKVCAVIGARETDFEAHDCYSAIRARTLD